MYNSTLCHLNEIYNEAINIYLPPFHYCIVTILC